MLKNLRILALGLILTSCVAVGNVTLEVEDKIDFRIGPALETLVTLLSDGKQESYDFAFIDADKVEYQGYFDKSLELLRTGGIIAVDNVLWGGSVIDDSVQNLSTIAIREFNERLKTDPRVSISMLPIGDGLTLARKL